MGFAKFKKSLFFSLGMAAGALTATAAEETFEMDCTYETGSSTSRIVAAADSYTFTEPFTSSFMPTTAFIQGEQPDYFVVRNAVETEGEGSNVFNLFVSNWVGKDRLAPFALDVLGDFVDVAQIEAARISFPTDLYLTLVYAELRMKDKSVQKISVAGLFPGICK